MIAERLRPGEALGLRRALTHSLDPVELFRRLCAGGLARGTALLETAEAAGSGRGGRSLLVLRSALRLVCRAGDVSIEAQNDNGASLLPWLEERLASRVEVSREDRCLRCTFPRLATGSEEQRLTALSPVDAVRSLLDGLIIDRDQPTAVPLVAGTLAYDLIDSYEALPPAAGDPHGWPDYELWLADRAVWVDAERGRLTLVAQVFGGEHAQRSYLAATSDLKTLLGDVEACGQQFRSACSARSPGRDRPGPPSPTPASASTASATSDLDDAAYAALVAKLKQHIIAGDVFQIVPSRAFSLPCPDPLAAYRELRALNPSPYMFLINGADSLLFGASPETAVRVEGSPRTVTIRPIAGTRPRGRTADGLPDADLDGRLEAELRLDEKEVAEHMMLVDLARNDVARISRAGTRKVDKLLTVERYSHVMHLVSQVSGELRDDLDALHAYVATMNMGTLVGAPKIRAAELLRENEATKRAAYGGAVGYFTADGRMDSAIVIRSALVQNGSATVRAGAGVVYDSDPQAEADESRRKAQAVLTAIHRAAGAA